MQRNISPGTTKPTWKDIDLKDIVKTGNMDATVAEAFRVTATGNPSMAGVQFKGIVGTGVEGNLDNIKTLVTGDTSYAEGGDYGKWKKFRNIKRGNRPLEGAFPAGVVEKARAIARDCVKPNACAFLIAGSKTETIVQSSNYALGDPGAPHYEVECLDYKHEGPGKLKSNRTYEGDKQAILDFLEKAGKEGLCEKPRVRELRILPVASTKKERKIQHATVDFFTLEPRS